MKTNSLLTAVLGMLLICASTALAAPQQKPPCGTNGPLRSTEITPSNYSYVQTSTGSQTASFTVSSPPTNITGACDSSLAFVYGNGDSGSSIDVLVRVTDVSNSDGTPLTLTDDQVNALKNAFTFKPATFTLNDPGKGSEVVILIFTNTSDVPPGEYDVNIQTKIANPDLEKGLGIGPANKTFTVNVTAPQQVILDTLPPVVSITSPADASFRLLNAPLHVEFTATDPVESGAGTGVWAMRAFVTSCADTYNQPLAPPSISPSLSVAAGVTATATEDTTAGQIGSFTLKAEADDNATPAIHTGSDVKSFTVGVGVTTLPPISVTGRQFNTGSTVPIKWTLTDAGGAFLPPFTSITAVVTSPSGATTAFVAGDGANAIRWVLDATGNATQYMANFQIPSAGPGTYTVAIYVNNVCGAPALQGTFSFFAVNNGASKK